MKDCLFTGVCTALVTPFMDNQVNYPMLEKLLKRQCDAGIEAIVICGTTGEAPTLSDDEKLEMFSHAKKCVGNNCKIIAGTGSNSTMHTLELSKAAERCGVDGLLIVTPYYNKATPDGLYAHYEVVAQSVKIPIIVYNVPSRTGLDVPLPVYQKLCRVPNIAGAKEASADITKITKLRFRCGDDLQIWSGNDDMIVPMISLGAKGVISVLSNVLPEEAQMLARSALAGDYETASTMQIALQPLIEALFCEVNPVPVKEAMRIIGFDCGGCRMPLGSIQEGNRKKLLELLRP